MLNRAGQVDFPSDNTSTGSAGNIKIFLFAQYIVPIISQNGNSHTHTQTKCLIHTSAYLHDTYDDDNDESQHLGDGEYILNPSCPLHTRAVHKR